MTDDAATLKIRSILRKQMQQARRGGCWFRLQRTNRHFCELALSVRIRFESERLTGALVRIFKRLKAVGD